jgi:hypothetical protein
MEKTELVMRREYSKGDQRLALVVRVLSGDGIDGVVFRYETWTNNIEDTGKRIDSGDVYYLSRVFYGNLIDLYHEGWKRENVKDGEGKLKEHARFFDPSML